MRKKNENQISLQNMFDKYLCMHYLKKTFFTKVLITIEYVLSNFRLGLIFLAKVNICNYLQICTHHRIRIMHKTLFG